MQTGDTIEHYRLIRDVGAGGFATVWLAEDQFLDAPVAIKILADNWARDHDVNRRFIEEAKIMRRIDHERIVRVFSVNVLPSGQPMFVMTFADRGTLADRIRQRANAVPLFSDAEVASIVGELADCLSVVHDFGIVHRDLKPSNILYRTARRYEVAAQRGGPDGAARSDEVMVLADFGIAKDTFQSSGFTMAAGTPGYMAPEQANSSSILDIRADIYSATAVVFELLTGVPPYGSMSLTGVGRVDSTPTGRLAELRPDVAPAWRELISRGMARQPADRFRDAEEFADAVRDAAGSPSVEQATDPPRPTLLRVDRELRLTGVRGRVDEIVREFAAERPEGVDRRLHEACGVTVVGTRDDLDIVRAGAVDLDVAITRLDPSDVRIGESDLLVLGRGRTVDEVRDVISEAAAGPVDAVTLDDRDIAEVLNVLVARADDIRASAALAILETTVRRAGSLALSEAWVRVGDPVEELRFDVPAFADLEVLRAVVSGRLIVPPGIRDEIRRLLFETDPAARLGMDTALTDRELTRSAEATIAELRRLRDSGRVSFASRSAVDAAIRSAERLWAELDRQRTQRRTAPP